GSDVGSVYFSVKDEDDRDLEYRYLLYYSSNKIEARKCVYTIRENDNIYEKTKKLQPYVAFGFLIPCGTNMDPDIKVIKASFYDKEGNLVYEDIRE
ncbi:MAG: hypothetical protein PUC33_02495, partial [Oscillospiraceae bacterium]|nr:hypothetical protein [Oscillospiraceae bacterium]